MKFLYTLWLTFAFVNSSFSQTDGNSLFDDSFLHEIRFESVDTNLFLTTEDYQRLKMTVDGNAVDSIGFKKKGNISGYSNPNKLGIKIKTNKYVAGKEYDGIKEFTLHMNYQDPTMMREKLTYDICSEMGLFSLRAAFAKVYINDNYWGLYTLIEGKDEMYKQVFDNKDMDAIESLDFGSMCYISANPNDYDYTANGGNPTYELSNGNAQTAWSRFSIMIDKANNTPNNQYIDTVSTYLNLKHFFSYQAINVYLMNFDSYIGFLGNQIYVYDTTARLWQVTPWDFNASFGLWNTNNFSPSNYPMIPEVISSGCIASKINSFPQLKTYYLDAMCHLNNTVGDTLTYFNKIDQWKNQIQQAVYEDTRKHVTNADFDLGTEYGYHSLFGDNQPALKTLITERLAVVKQGLINENYVCTATANSDELVVENSINIYPNPSNNLIRIKLNDTGDKLDQMSILDVTGQVIIQLKDVSKEINIEELPIGLYYIHILNGKDLYIGKFVKINAN